jgi:hypothetical protein
MPDNDINVQDIDVQDVQDDDMLDENDLEVPRGFLIALDSHGNYVPFFLKVRKEDIVYSDVLNTKLYGNIINKFDSLGLVYEHQMVDITKELEIKKDGWTFYIKPDGTFKATYIKNTGFTNWLQKHMRDNSLYYIDHVTAEVPIPLPIKQTATSPCLIGNLTPKTLDNQSESLTPRIGENPLTGIFTYFGLSNINNKPYYTTVNVSISCLDSMLISRGISLTDGSMNTHVENIENDCFTLNIHLEGQLDMNEFGITE